MGWREENGMIGQIIEEDFQRSKFAITGLSQSRQEKPQEQKNRALFDSIDADPYFEDMPDENDADYSPPAPSKPIFDPAVKEDTGRTISGTIDDLAIATTKGMVAVPQAITGLIDIPAGGRFGKWQEEKFGLDYQGTQEYYDTLKSPAQKKADRALAEADGFWDSAGTMIMNPSTIVNGIVESIPLMIAGGSVGQGVAGAAGKVAGRAGGHVGKIAEFLGKDWVAGAVGEGAMGAGSHAEQVRASNPEGDLSLKDSALAIGSGAGTAAFGMLGGKLAKKFGFADVDTMLVNFASDLKAKDVGKAILAGGFSEGMLEELPQSAQETIWMNFAMDRPWNEGVPESMAQGLMTGAVMGGTIAGYEQKIANLEAKKKKEGLTDEDEQALLGYRDELKKAQAEKAKIDRAEARTKGVTSETETDFNDTVKTLKAMDNDTLAETAKRARNLSEERANEPEVKSFIQLMDIEIERREMQHKIDYPDHPQHPDYDKVDALKKENERLESIEANLKEFKNPSAAVKKRLEDISWKMKDNDYERGQIEEEIEDRNAWYEEERKSLAAGNPPTIRNPGDSWYHPNRIKAYKEKQKQLFEDAEAIFWALGEEERKQKQLVQDEKNKRFWAIEEAKIEGPPKKKEKMGPPAPAPGTISPEEAKARKTHFDKIARELGDYDVVETKEKNAPRTQRIYKETPRGLPGAPDTPLMVNREDTPFTADEAIQESRAIQEQGGEAEIIPIKDGYGLHIKNESDQFGDFMYQAHADDLEQQMQGETEAGKIAAQAREELPQGASGKTVEELRAEYEASQPTPEVETKILNSDEDLKHKKGFSDQYLAFGREYASKVSGKAVTLEGFPNTEFFVYSAGRGSWGVAEKTTGARIAIGTTEKKAIEEAKRTFSLKSATEEVLQKEMSKIKPLLIKDPAPAASEPTKAEVKESLVNPGDVELNPTEKQKESGTYKKGHVKYQGYDITIENPHGSTRSGKDAQGKEWSSKMNGDYGYFKRTLGKDGDQVDVVVAPGHKETDSVFVVDQVVPGTNKFDEHKVMMGVNTKEEAEALYLSNYEKGWKGNGGITELSQTEFKAWLGDRNRTKERLFSESGVARDQAGTVEAPLEVGDAVEWTQKGKVMRGTLKVRRGQGFIIAKDGGGNTVMLEKNLKRVPQGTPMVEKPAKVEPAPAVPVQATPVENWPESYAAPTEKPGEVKQTMMGRETTPFPKIDTSTSRKTKNSVGRHHSWLVQNAIEEAKARGDKDNIRTFETMVNTNLSPSDVDTAQAYLFEWEPQVQQPTTRPLALEKKISSKAAKAATRKKLLAEADELYKNAGDSYVSDLLHRAVAEYLDGDNDHTILEEAISKAKKVLGQNASAPKPKTPKKKKSSALGNQLKAEWAKQAKTKEAEEARAKEQKEAQLKERMSNAASNMKDSTAKMMEAFKNINAILGERGSFSTHEADEDIYQQIKDQLNIAWGHAQDTGRSIVEFVTVAMDALSHKATPYFERWVDEEIEGNKDDDTTTVNAGQDGSQKESDRGSDAGKSAGNVSEAVTESEGAEKGGQGPGAPSDESVRSGVKSDNVGSGARGSRAKGSSGKDSSSGTKTASSVGNTAGSSTDLRKRDYRITKGSIEREGGWKTAARNNLAAIRVLKTLQEENRLATKAEQKALAKYVGWGASELANNMFPGVAQHGELREPYKGHPYYAEVMELKELLTPEEIKAAAKSTQYAHYTSESVIRSIYKGLAKFGFKGGQILEPGMGVGNFVGLLPAKMRDKTTYTGIERDLTSAGIAQALYPGQNIMQQDFIKARLPKNFFDAAIGNPPFSGDPILADPEYAKQRLSLHNYFFVKSLDRVRPGGLLVFVTSRYTMDARSDKARSIMAEKADLLGAIRLPQTAFKKNAGTDVVTDVLFLRKKDPGNELDAKLSKSWGNVVSVKLGEHEKMVNEYFEAHPEMILGEQSTEGSMYRQDEYTVKAKEDTDIEKEFDKAVRKLPGKIYQEATGKTKQAHDTQAVIERDFDPKNHKEGGLYVSDAGDLMKVDQGSGVPLKLNKKQTAMLKSYCSLRDRVKESLKAQREDGDWETALKALQKEYRKFVNQHGRILEHSTKILNSVNEDGEKIQIESRRHLKENTLKLDAEFSLVYPLEEIKANGTIVEGPPLTGRTIKIPKTRKIETVADALAVSLDQVGVLDLDDVAERIKMPVEKVEEVLGDLVYRDPSREGKPVLFDEYLSGNVVRKLQEAEAAFKLNPVYQRNVEALETAQPDPLKAEQVTIPMGANWVKTKIYEHFAKEVLGMPPTRIEYRPADNSWTVTGYRESSWDDAPYSPQGLRSSSNDWGTDLRGPNEILQAVLNNQSIRLRKATGEGNKTEPDIEGTAAANQIANNMRKRFSSWIWEDAERAGELLALYNEKYNNIAPRKFDGSHLTLPGASLLFNLYDHQKRAIWRIIQAGNTYLNHAVGAGKTFSMIAAGMEMKRLGMIQKPLYAVPKHMLGQFAKEFQELYPMANVMVADPKNFSKAERAKFIAQAAMNAPDAIVMPHTTFKTMPISEEHIAPVREKFIKDMRWALEELQDEDAPKRAIKEMEKRIERTEQRFDSLTAGEDGAVSFEELGCDFLFLDEAHEFRKLDFVTNRQVKGIDPQGSKGALSLFIKTLYLESLHPGRSHCFASGTPITNTLAELYTVQRYFDDGSMGEAGIDHFDSWATLFGEVADSFEMNAAGNHETVERFSRFINLPELMSRVRSFMDVLTFTQLGDRVTRPAIESGTPEIVLAPKTEALTAYLKDVLEPRIARCKSWKPTREEPNNKDPMINIITDGRLASIDLRFVDSRAKNDPESKLNKYIDGIIEGYKGTSDMEFMEEFGGDKVSSIKGGSLISFYNLGFGKMVKQNRGFDSKAWVNKRLKDAGIPASKIAWIEEYNTPEKKESLFNDVRQGKVRIMFGSAKQMGTGVNAQNRLKQLHYLDAPWYPADVEQPDGRILRQKNQNEQVVIKRYATKGSYDATMWQMVARKSSFIEQAFMGDKNLRQVEDVSETSQYEMAAAIASGDQRVVELVKAQGEVERLSNLQSAYRNNQYKLGSEKRHLEAEVGTKLDRLDAMKEAQEVMPEYIREIDGKVAGSSKKHDNRHDFGEALKKKAWAIVSNIRGNTGDIPLGTFNGIKMVVELKRYKRTNDFFQRAYIKMLPTKDYTPEVPGLLIDSERSADFKDVSASGLVTKLTNLVNQLPTKISSMEKEIKGHEAELKRISKRLGSPFPQGRELTEQIAEVARLQAELAEEGEEVEVTQTKEAPQADEPENKDGAPQYSTRTTPPGQAVTLKDVQRMFPGQAVGLSNDGSVWIRLRNGAGCQINTVKRLSSGEYQFAIKSGKMGRDGEIAGKYKENTITLASDFADTGTLAHEICHWLEDIGVITQSDQIALDGKARALNRQGKFKETWNEDMAENRANLIAQVLADRKAYRGTLVGRIVQKMGDFLDALVNLGKASTRKIAREMESGKIYDQEARKATGGTKYKTTASKAEQAKNNTAWKSAHDWASSILKPEKVKEYDKKDLKVIERLLSVLSHFKGTDATADKVIDLILNKSSIKIEKETDLFNTQGGVRGEFDHFTEGILPLKKKDQAKYKKLNDYIVNRDINQVGWKVKKVDSQYQAVDIKGKEIGTPCNTEAAAEQVAIEHEVSHYQGTDLEKQALRSYRNIAMNAYHHYFDEWLNIIEAAELNGEQVPEIVMETADGTVEIDVRTALRIMGDRRGHYFPRIREPGKLVIRATKKGEHPIREYRDSRVLATKRKKELEAQGYTVEDLKPNAVIPEKMFEGIRASMAEQAATSRVLSKIPIYKRSLADLKYKGKMKDDTFILTGPIAFDPAFDSLMESLGGKVVDRVKKTSKGVNYTPQVEFKNPPADIEKKLVDALFKHAGLSSSVNEQFVADFVQELANQIRSRGSRARMIPRSDAKGKEVVKGYEEDLAAATAQLVAGAAGGYAKQTIAQQGYSMMMGMETTWEEFQAQHKDSTPLLAAQTALEKLIINTPEEVERIQAAKKTVADLRKKLFRKEFTSEQEAAALIKQIEDDRKGAYFEYSDKKKAQALRKEIGRLSSNIWRAYADLVDSNKIDPVKQENLHAELTNNMEDVLRNDDSIDRLVGRMRAATVFYFLAGRVSSAAINMTNLVIGVPAVAKSKGLSFHGTGSAIAKHLSLYTQWKFGSSRVSAGHRALYQAMADKGLDQPQLHQEAFDAMQSKVGRGYNKMMTVLMSGFSVTETLNRASTIGGAYEMLAKKAKVDLIDENGNVHPDLLKQAVDISDLAHGVYEKSNRPGWMKGEQPAARMLGVPYTFMTFTHNYLLTMTKMGWAGIKGADLKKPGTWLNDDAQGALWMAFAPAMFGIKSSLGVSLITLIARALGVDEPEDEFYDWLDRNFGPIAERIARFGITGIPEHGIDLTGSLKMGIPDGALGAFGGMAGDMWDGAQNLSKGLYWKAAEDFSPAFVQNMFEAARKYDKGVTTRTGSPIFDKKGQKVQHDKIDAFIEALSFRPSRSSAKLDKIYTDKRVLSKYREKKSDIYQHLKGFLIIPPHRRNPADMIRIKGMILDYNRMVRDKGSYERGATFITEASIKAILRTMQPKKSKRSTRASRREHRMALSA